MKKLKPSRENLYDAVEQSAIRRVIASLKLWKLVLRAINQDKLAVAYPSKSLPSGLHPLRGSLTWESWMEGFRNAAEGDCSPESCGGSTIEYLRMIQVDKTAFDKWLRKATKGTRGPRRGTSGFASADRKHFPAIDKMLGNGEARGAYGAALKLAPDSKITHVKPESWAKRVASRYKREWQR